MWRRNLLQVSKSCWDASLVPLVEHCCENKTQRATSTGQNDCRSELIHFAVSFCQSDYFNPVHARRDICWLRARTLRLQPAFLLFRRRDCWEESTVVFLLFRVCGSSSEPLLLFATWLASELLEPALKANISPKNKFGTLCAHCKSFEISEI